MRSSIKPRIIVLATAQPEWTHRHTV